MSQLLRSNQCLSSVLDGELLARCWQQKFKKQQTRFYMTNITTTIIPYESRQYAMAEEMKRLLNCAHNTLHLRSSPSKHFCNSNNFYIVRFEKGGWQKEVQLKTFGKQHMQHMTEAITGIQGSASSRKHQMHFQKQSFVLFVALFRFNSTMQSLFVQNTFSKNPFATEAVHKYCELFLYPLTQKADIVFSLHGFEIS